MRLPDDLKVNYMGPVDAHSQDLSHVYPNQGPQAIKLFVSDPYSSWRYGRLDGSADAVTVMNAVISRLCRAQDLPPTVDGGFTQHLGRHAVWACSFAKTTDNTAASLLAPER